MNKKIIFIPNINEFVDVVDTMPEYSQDEFFEVADIAMGVIAYIDSCVPLEALPFIKVGIDKILKESKELK